jgi:hypothetical protein
MNWKEFLRPTKWKIILSIVISFIVVVWGILFYMIQNPTYPVKFIIRSTGTLYVNSIVISIFDTSINFLISAILYYPFASSLSYLWPKYRQGKFWKSLREKKVFLSFFILNPFVLQIILNMTFFILLLFAISLHRI